MFCRIHTGKFRRPSRFCFPHPLDSRTSASNARRRVSPWRLFHRRNAAWACALLFSLLSDQHPPRERLPQPRVPLSAEQLVSCLAVQFPQPFRSPLPSGCDWLYLWLFYSNRSRRAMALICLHRGLVCQDTPLPQGTNPVAAWSVRISSGRATRRVAQYLPASIFLVRRRPVCPQSCAPCNVKKIFREPCKPTLPRRQVNLRR